MARGDHIKVRRLGYTHHGIDLGDGTVVHYSGLCERLAGGPVEVVSRERFARGQHVHVIRHRSGRHPDQVVEAALSRLGEDRYHLLFCNCEHFAYWAVTGRRRSPQVLTVVAGVCGAGFAVAAVIAAKYGPTGGSRA